LKGLSIGEVDLLGKGKGWIDGNRLTVRTDQADACDVQVMAEPGQEGRQLLDPASWLAKLPTEGEGLLGEIGDQDLDGRGRRLGELLLTLEDLLLLGPVALPEDEGPPRRTGRSTRRKASKSFFRIRIATRRTRPRVQEGKGKGNKKTPRTALFPLRRPWPRPGGAGLGTLSIFRIGRCLSP